MNVSKFVFIVIFVLASRVFGATYYIDYASGSDSNPGTKAAPWKVHPAMRGWAGTHTLQPGDQYIFKGGVVWPASALPLKPISGAANLPSYYGVDQTWFSGAAWTRPCFDGGYTISTAIDIASLSWVTFDGLELKRVTSSSNYGWGLMQGYQPSYITLTNCYIHGWQTTAGTDDAHGGVIMTGFGANVDTLLMQDCEIENLENQAKWNGVAVRMWGTIRRCKIHHNSSAVLFCLDFDGCDLYNICHPASGFDSAYHFNGVYLDAKTLNKTVGYIRNSRVRDCGGGANMAYINPRAAKLYCYNNVFWGQISDQRAIEVEPYNYGVGGTDGEAYIYNNTGYIEPSSPFVHVVDRGTNPKLSVLAVRNNHVIGTSVTVHDGNAASIATLTVSNNVVQSDTTATSQGYTSTNLWAPTDAADATVNQGVSVAGVFTTDINGNNRVDPWDVGAYEYGSGGAVNTPPTVSAIVQDAQDADPVANGYQTFAGAIVKYSADASDSNGDPLSWTWKYSKNGGADTTVSTGTGAVQPAAFNYSSAVAGDAFTWKLLVSDGKATTTVQLVVGIIAAPVPETGFVLEAEAGQLSGGFVAQNGYISQPTQTGVADGGRAAYPLTINVAGDYVIYGTVNAPTEANNSLYFNFDAEPVDPDATWQIPVTSGFEERQGSWQGGGTWDNPQYVPKKFSLTAGAHTLIVRGREAGTQLDKIRVVKIAAITNAAPTVSAITSSVADADSVAAGMQVNQGSTVQYSASASDPNGDPVSWNWRYSRNGGAETIVSSGTGAVTPVSYNYSNASAGDAFVWTIQVSDGQATTTSQLSVSVIGTSQIQTPPAGSAAFYIDYAAGSDSNAGTKTAPWKRHPYMNGWTGSYAPKAGDRFIFKGGVVWPSAVLPFKVTASGGTDNPTYFGVDQTWFAGSAWTRPCFDGEYAIPTIIDFDSLNWLTFEGLELKRVTSSATNGYGLVLGYQPGNILLKNCYLHGWQTTATTDDAHGGVIMTGYGPNVHTLVMEDCELENSENQSRWNGVAVRMWGTIRRCKIHHNSSAVLFFLDFDGSDLYNICHPVSGFDVAYHWNGLYLDAKTMNKTVGYIRNSRIRDVSSGANMAYLNPRAAKLYCYNNVFWGEISDQRAVEVEPYNYGVGGTDGEAYVYNNTAYIEPSSPMVHVVDRGGNPRISVLAVQNNHIIGTTVRTQDGTSTTVATTIESNNLIQTDAIATSLGYTSGNFWAPTSASGPTVDQGVAESAVFSTDINGNTRTTPWDIGAYEYGATGTSNTPPTVTAINQNLQDADMTAAGLQVFGGWIAQYSASASDANNDPLSWSWKYSKNGAADVVAASGSGPVQPVSFDYSTATAGDSFAWKVEVSDGKATSSSQLSVGVIPNPLPEDGFALQADAGQLSGGFVAQSGMIQQPTQTALTDAACGRAVYPITITVPGDYAIIGVVNAPSEANNSLYFNIDQEPIDPDSVWQIPVTSGFEERAGSWQGKGTWDNPELVPKKFTLTKGAHTLIIRGREAGTQLQRIMIVKLPSSPAGVQVKEK